MSQQMYNNSSTRMLSMLDMHRMFYAQVVELLQ